MLGKAVFEGIIIDLPFAHFFVNSFLNRGNSFNELSTLDPDLNRNLCFVRQFSGDFQQLDLVFAVDDLVFGELVSTPLLPGGTSLGVTAENKILYCHLMADYKLNKYGGGGGGVVV